MSELVAEALILPNIDCRRLQHRIETRPKVPGPGKYEVCIVCTYGHAMALYVSDGDHEYADRFVQSIRAEGTYTPTRLIPPPAHPTPPQ